MWPSNVWSPVGKVTPHLVKLSVMHFFWLCWLLATFLNEALLLSGCFLLQACHIRFPWFSPHFFRTHKWKQIWWHSAFLLSTPAILWNHPFCFWLCNATHLFSCCFYFSTSPLEHVFNINEAPTETLLNIPLSILFAHLRKWSHSCSWSAWKMTDTFPRPALMIFPWRDQSWIVLGPYIIKVSLLRTKIKLSIRCLAATLKYTIHWLYVSLWSHD